MSVAQEATAAASARARVDVGVGVRVAQRVRAFYELGKPNLSGLVVVTGLIGFYLAAPAIDWARLLHLAVGLWCTAAGAGALNMFIERDIDARMRRTRTRPLPSGRVTPNEALAFSIAIFALGFAELWLFTNPLTAVLALVTLVIYAFIYTPLKRKGPIAIWVGAIPGAIPPVMGWVASSGRIEPGAIVLFAILFIWQFPHFLALAWLYREDYLRVGYDFLGGDRGGARTGYSMALGCLALIPVSSLLAHLGLTGGVYVFGAVPAGIGFLYFAYKAMREIGPTRARAVFFASIIYLPVLLVLIVADKITSGWFNG